jgi:type II secretory pathway component PulF
MSETESRKTEPISLDDLIALNEEIAALVRAGIPLEVGLGHGGDAPKKLQAIIDRLRRDMEQGSNLPDALRHCGAELPPSYLAIVEAGLKSNRLSDALISAAAFARTLREMQRSLRTSLVYPVLVLSIAYGFFLVMLTDLLPRMTTMLNEANGAPGRLLRDLHFLSRSVLYWGPALPVLGVIAAVWMGLIPLGASQRPAVLLDRLRFLPWLRRIVNDVQSASFCHLFSLLVERDVPLPDALEASGSASADARLAAECRQIAAELRKGQPLQQALRASRRLPGFTRWMLSAGQTQGALPSVMATLADVYRLRAQSRIEMFRMSAPLLLTMVLGGGAVAAYAFLLFVPVRNMLLELTRAG